MKDVNDNPPVFERPTYRTQITEEDDRNLPKRVLQVIEDFSSFVLQLFASPMFCTVLAYCVMFALCVYTCVFILYYCPCLDISRWHAFA